MKYFTKKAETTDKDSCDKCWKEPENDLDFDIDELIRIIDAKMAGLEAKLIAEKKSEETIEIPITFEKNWEELDE